MATWLWLQANALLCAPDRDSYDLSSLRSINIGGAATDIDLDQHSTQRTTLVPKR